MYDKTHYNLKKKSQVYNVKYLRNAKNATWLIIKEYSQISFQNYFLGDMYIFPHKTFHLVIRYQIHPQNLSKLYWV